MAFYAISGPIGFNIELFVKNLASTLGDDVEVMAESNYFNADKSLNIKRLLADIRAADNDVIVWGHYIFADNELRQVFTHKIFLDADLDTRLANYLVQTISNSNLDDVLKDYEEKVKPLNATTIDNYKIYADIVIPEQNQNANNIVFKLLAASSSSNQRDQNLDDRSPSGGKISFF